MKKILFQLGTEHLESTFGIQARDHYWFARNESILRQKIADSVRWSIDLKTTKKET